MLHKRKSSVFVEQQEERVNAKRRQSFDTRLSYQIPHIADPEISVRLKTIKFISAHLNYAPPLTLAQNIKPILQHQLWQENDPQLAQHILKLLADIAVHKHISKDKNTTFSIVEILHKYLEAHQFFDDFVTTQIVSSLISIAEETGSFKELERVLALKLLCTNKTNLRVKLLALLAVTSESKNDENGIVLEIFEGLTKDPFPSVRKAALDGLVRLHKKGYKLSKGCYKRATALLQDKDELVRLSAIKVVHEYVVVSHKIEEIHTTTQINQAFLQLCTLSRDMNMRVRSEALEALGEMGPLSENVLLQALSKKILGKATKKLTSGIQDVKDPLDCGEEFNLLTLSAAGAFLHGVEDEFFEVRVATIHSLVRLSGFSKQFADGALDLLMDMLNDDSLEVRMHTLHGLLHMAQLDHLRVQEKHMHMFLGMLEDINADIRSGARRLLGHMKLPSISMFKMSFNALIENLDKHPQDEKDIISVMYHIGKTHSTFVVCSSNEFVQKLTSYSNGESGLDHPHMPALLILMLAAQISNVGISFQIPQKLISYANYFHYKFPLTLFGSTTSANVKNSQLDDKQGSSGNSNCDEMVASLSKIPNDEEGNAMGLRSDQNFGSETSDSEANIKALDMKDGSANKLLNCEASTNVSDASEKAKGKVYSSYQSEILCSAENILKTVSGAWSLLKQKGLIGVLKNLGECKEALRKIERNFEEPISVISFASLYIRSIYFLFKLWANLSPRGCQQISPSGIDASQCILKKIENTIKRLGNCFLGLSEEQELRILELNALIYILRLSLLGVNLSSYVFKRLTSVICCAELLYKGDGLSHSPFLWKIKKSLSDENVKSLCFLKFVQELPEHFSIQSIPLGKELEEIRAVLIVPNSCYEQPFRFVPGLPIGITVHMTLHNVTSECSIWLVMVLAKSIQYDLIDVSEFQGLDGSKQGTITLPFYSTVKVASCYLEISVMMECSLDDERVLSCQAGPKGDLLLLSNVEKINLVASV
ncbi:hypothetical protein SUGI_0439750 [Cryptomeria japonica]|uniref:protein SIEL n=1 Tax=Cryptomeria japonica TaxID=3369 RepID=UPI002408B792|nr:protein SIEL [Cryptomeria japonica]GLJ23248.1 hypothetical protein SUGI_0439750 [Cryptomeria japonica]